MCRQRAVATQAQGGKVLVAFVTLCAFLFCGEMVSFSEAQILGHHV